MRGLACAPVVLIVTGWLLVGAGNIAGRDYALALMPPATFTGVSFADANGGHRAIAVHPQPRLISR